MILAQTVFSVFADVLVERESPRERTSRMEKAIRLAKVKFRPSFG